MTRLTRLLLKEVFQLFLRSLSWNMLSLFVPISIRSGCRCNTRSFLFVSFPASSHQLVRSKLKQSTIGIPRQAATQRNKSFKKLPRRTPDEQLDYLLDKQKEKQAKKEGKQAKKEGTQAKKDKKKQKPSKNDGMMQIGDGMLQLPETSGTNPFTVFGGRSLGN